MFVSDVITTHKLAAVLFLVAALPNAYARDVCLEGLPQSLEQQIAVEFPDYRIALSADQQLNDAEWNRAYYHPGTCQTVLRADFDGDHQQDFALFLVKKGGSTPKLVAALARERNWLVAELPQWNEHIAGCYMGKAAPGVYEHTAAFEFKPTTPTERESLATKNTGIMAGRVESTGVLYAFTEMQWLYVWVSD